ncbi:hypothetical protein POM88_043821 [Heracleum sosnowskyi]|uniref:TF-B3 domain-containing protein n=1 Tax=Heracleum sosnowskyi TaxID=360622 RepID=A0AAD8H1P5_9APIA|nr:hypothetical protein POM88_043821 [Heracleum sosnowskyi]
MERNEAYGYETGVPTSFGSHLNTMNHTATSYNNYLLGNTTTTTNPKFPPNYTTTSTNNPLFYPNINIPNNPANPFSGPNINLHDIYVSPFLDPNYNTTNNTNPFSNGNYYSTIPTIPTYNTLPPNYNFQQFTNTTNIFGTFQGAPLTTYNTNNYNIGVAENYENNGNMLVNSVQQQETQLNIGVQPHLDVGLDQNQINQDVQQHINMGVNSADHLGSFVFSDEEISGSINRSLRRNVIDESRLKLLFEKQLQNSDVNNLKRMVIPKKPAEAFLPELDERSGISIKMAEIDRSHVWTFTYRFWPNNKSRMYILENTGEFVRKHQLRSGDFIRVFEDTESKEYVIEAKKLRRNVLYKPKPKKVRNQCNRPMNDVDAAASSLEGGNGLPLAAAEIQSMGTTVDNYMQPNYGFDACSSSSIMDNVVNYPTLINNHTSVIYNDMNSPNDYLFSMWERGTNMYNKSPHQ